MARVMIYFQHDGELKRNEQGQYTWIPKSEPPSTFGIIVKDDIKYVELVDKLYKRMKLDPNEFELKLSYLPAGFAVTSPINVTDDESLNGLIFEYQSGQRSFLCVELIEKHNVEFNVNDECCAGLEYGNDDVCAGLEDDYFNRTFIPNATNMCDLGSAAANEGVNAEDEHADIVASAPSPPFTGYQDEDCEPVMIEGNSYSFTDGSDFAIGMEFASKAEFARKMEEVAISACFEMSVDRSTKSLLVYKCVDKSCNWFVRAAKITNSEYFSIRTYCNIHTCDLRQRRRNHRQASQSTVANMVIRNFQGQRQAPMPKTIMTMMENRNMQVSYWKAYRGRLLANNLLRGSPEASFQALPAYLYMVEAMNPGTITNLVVDENDRFKYLFLAYGPCIRGLQCMRKVVAVDGTFLKGKYKGTLLVATAQDGNHQQYPIAWAVVDSENHRSWGWFFEQLLSKGIVPDDDEVVFISDRHQSIIQGVRTVYSHASHGHCTWHIKNNLKCRVRHEHCWNLFTSAAYAYKISEFQYYYTELKNRYSKGYEYLEESLDVHTWARAYFPAARYNIMTTNGAESINAALREAREYPLIALLDKLQELTSTWFNSRRNDGQSCGSVLTPYAESILRDRFRDAAKLKVIQLNLVQYNVRGSDNNNNIVDLSKKQCSCRVFDVDKLPCVHACACYETAQLDIYSLCSDYYRADTWVLAYAETIYPVPPEADWDIPEGSILKNVQPPDVKGDIGRAKKNRIPSVGESSRSKSRCSLCGQTGHNKKKCSLYGCTSNVPHCNDN